YVVHYDIPHNVESYYQETGRAGRDGLPSEALLLFGFQDVVVARSLIEQSENPEQVRIKLHKLNAMVGFAEPLGCRRRALLAYFGEKIENDCGNCDMCLHPPQKVDATQEARKALSAVYRLNQGFGMGHVIDVLRGAQNQRMKDLGHDSLSVYGIGTDRSRDFWGALIRQLIHNGYLLQDVGAWSVLKLTDTSRPLLRGEVSFSVVQREELPATGPKKKRRQKSDEAVDGSLFEQLRAVRKELAVKYRKPPFVIFSDATLVEMVKFLPTDETAFLAISGVGLTKLKRYGKHFLPVIRQHCSKG
ncbi:HRDC domain-containing protein, partial [Myxococcota bacterium]|nr:HRDC domain-containing protein [Myxococcota bacterium]